MSSQIEKFKCPLGYCETMICGELQPVLCPIAIAISMHAPLTHDKPMHAHALLQPVRDTDTVLRARRPVLTWLSAGTTCFAGLSRTCSSFLRSHGPVVLRLFYGLMIVGFTIPAMTVVYLFFFSCRLITNPVCMALLSTLGIQVF